MAISKALNGITSRCSRVPCSRSRMTAAPVRMIASIVTWLMIATTPENHEDSPFGLNNLFTMRFIGSLADWSVRERNVVMRSLMMFLM